MQVGVGLLVTDVMLYSWDCLRYHHNYALFYQLLNSSLFTHCIIFFQERSLWWTLWPCVYILSYYFQIYKTRNPKITFCNLFIFTLFFFLLIFYISLLDLTLASDHEGVDNPFFALGASVCWFVHVHLLGTCLYLLLDWYLGSQTEGNTYLYFFAPPFPLQGKNQRKLKK